jgi:hypothetical protein
MIGDHLEYYDQDDETINREDSGCGAWYGKYLTGLTPVK